MAPQCNRNATFISLGYLKRDSHRFTGVPLELHESHPGHVLQLLRPKSSGGGGPEHGAGPLPHPREGAARVGEVFCHRVLLHAVSVGADGVELIVWPGVHD